jgi:hypothetical protein
MSGVRDLTISRMHREWPDEWRALDLDLVGYCPRCLAPVYVWEATRAANKGVSLLIEIARRLDCPGVLVQYRAAGDTSGIVAVEQSPRHVRIGDAAALYDYTRRLRAAHECEGMRRA